MAAQPARILTWAALVIIAAYAVLLLGMWSAGVFLSQPDGRPVRTDFVAIWTAGQMARDGTAAAAYDWSVLEAAMAALGVPTPAGMAPLGWLHPPTFFLLAAPAAALPLAWAFAAWQVIGIGLFAAVLSAVAPGWRGAASLAGLAALAALLCFLQGQTGFLQAALLGGALLILDRRPRCAGLLLGLATFKPHLALPIPVLLAASGRWTAFGAAAVTSLALAGIAIAIFGLAPWTAFIASLDGSAGRFLSGAGQRVPLQTAFSAAMDGGAAWTVAAVAHGAVALAALGAALLVWRHPRADGHLRAAAALASGFLCTPYALPHDGVILVMAGAFLLGSMQRRGALPGDYAMLVVALILLPALCLATRWSVPMPLSAAMLLCLVLRRLLSPRRQAASPASADALPR